MIFRDPPGTRVWQRRVGERFPAAELPSLAGAANRVMADLERTLAPEVAETIAVILRELPGTGWCAGVVVGDGRHEGSFISDGHEEAALGIADVAGTMLSGYEFIQWPSLSGRMLAAEMRDGRAVWVDLRTRYAVAVIGQLAR